MSNNENLGHGGQVTMRKNLTVVLSIRDESSIGPFSESEVKDLEASFKVLGEMKQEEGFFTFDMGKHARSTDYQRITDVLKAYSVRHQRRMVFTMMSSDGEVDVAKILLDNKEATYVTMMEPRAPELKPASETVESTGFIDGVWIAGRNKAVAVYLTVPESQDVSTELEELMDANFMDFKRIDSHQLFLTYRRLQETAFNDIKERVVLFNLNTGNHVGVHATVHTGDEIDSINERIKLREGLLWNDLLPKVNTFLPTPPVKPPKLELVTRAAVHPDMFNLDVSVKQRVTTKVLDVTIGSDRPWGSEYEATASEKEAWNLIVQSFPSIRMHRSTTRIHNSFTGNGMILLSVERDDPHKMLDTLDKINKEFPSNIRVTLYDPNLIPVKPVEPGVRVMKNHADVSNHRVFARVTVETLDGPDREFFQMLCIASNGKVISDTVFEIDLGANPDEHILRSVVAGLIQASSLQGGDVKCDYQFFQRHVSVDGKVSKDAVTVDEKKKVVQATIHGEMTTDIVQKFSKAFPVTGSWLNSHTFQVECGEHETPFEVALALNVMVNEVNDARNKGLIRRFWSDRKPGQIPPPPGSDESKRQSALWGAVDQNFNNNLDGAIKELEKQIETRPLENIPKDELANDPAIKALGALRYTKAAARKRVIKARLWRFFIVALLIAIGGAIYQYNEYLFDRGYATSVLDCSVPYGSDRLTGKRYVTSEYRSLFGVRLSFDSNIKDVTKLDLPNDNIILLGINPKNNKPWRMNFGKGEQGAQPLQPTEQYWFVGNKDAATVSYSNFCTKG